MAESRPYVINANIIKLLNSAPVSNMRPSLGSLVQRKTIDIGCHPFPFMVNEENIPLDGRTIVSNGAPVKLPIRLVPFWCSENTYARYPGDQTFNNGKISWAGNKGYVKSNIEGNNLNLEPVFLYDQTLGVTYTQVRYNTAFISMDNTVPKQWLDIKNAVFAPGGFDDVRFIEGSTYEIGNNILFKAWSGLTVDLVEPGGLGDNTYGFFPMNDYIGGGGTFSPFFDRYNYECLDQILNSDRFLTVGIDPKTFWEGAGASYGASGGLTGELFLLNAVTGGANAGSYFILSVSDGLLDIYLYQGFSGATLPGKDLAKNLYGIANEPPFIGINEKIGSNGNNAGFIETMAFLLATNQKFVTLTGTGGTASLRALDFNNPCSASFAYDESTVLGRWGYEVQPISVGEDVFIPGEQEVGCNVNTFIEYVSGATAKAHGIVHPLSWMFWKGISSGNAIARYAPGFIHDYVGDDELGQPIYNKLEGIHDYLCYEHFDSTGLLDRVYYPLRPITKQWYDQQVATKYTENVEGQVLAQQFGLTLDKKYDTAFTDAFKGSGSIGAISLRSLQQNNIISINFDGTSTNLNGVTGILFPYFVPLASFAMQGINTNFPGSVNISGEFSRFDGVWTKTVFGIPEDGSGDSTTLKQVYQYYAEGISSGADFGIDDGGGPVSPFNRDIGGFPNMRLFSWNALTRISPFDLQSNVQRIVRSSFSSIATDRYGKAEYLDPNTPNRITMNGADIDVDPLNYPPAALPDTEFGGLTYETLDGDATVIANLGCSSYINVIRYANINAPNEASTLDIFGLTAQRELISDVVLGASKKTFLEFDPAKSISDVPNTSANFNRSDTTPTANNNTDFYHQTPGGFRNFFFTTPAEESFFPVFENPYYLSAANYIIKYPPGGGAGQDVIWWEDIDINGLITAAFWLDIPALAQDIVVRLQNGEGWAGRDESLGFRLEPYNIEVGVDPTNGVIQALTDGVHPAFVYRLFATKIFGDLGIESDCASSWRSGGIPCHKIPAVSSALASNGGIYNSYFLGDKGCNNVGEEFPVGEFETKKGKDFFAGCAVEVVQSPLGDDFFNFAFFDGSGFPYSPFPKLVDNPYFFHQNVGCDGGTNIPDPPTNASLTTFGRRFGIVLNIVENKSVDLDNAKDVRDVLFAYPGSTASIDGIRGSEPTNPRVSDWLQDKLNSVFEYWNTNRTNRNSDLLEVEGFLLELYPILFGDYRDSFDSSSTFRVWAVKPKCVEEWTPECSDLAHRLRNEVTFRSASVAPRSIMFRDEEVNAGADPSRRFVSPPYGYDTPTIGNVNSPITSSDIINQNEGFIGAFKTIFIEPLGLATNVLASEAQAVPRATISSTVLGKLTTIIDSSGFLRDVNEITFESGFGTKILGDNTTGTITISVQGLTLGSLEDVAVTGATSGDILIFDGESGKWVNRPFADVVQPFLAGFTGFTGSFEAGTNFFYQDSAPDAGVTIGSRWMDSNTGIEYIYVNDGDNDLWLQSSVDTATGATGATGSQGVQGPTGPTGIFVYETVLIEGATYQAFDTDYYIGVSYGGVVTITLPSDPEEGKTVVVKDASGRASYTNRSITVVGATSGDRIDNQDHATINIDNGALQFIYKDGWRII